MKEGYIKVVLGVVISAISLVTSYCVVASPLARDANLKTDDLTWSVGFSDAYRADVTGEAREISKPKFDKNFAYFHVAFSAPGDSATYDFVIKNTGKMDAKVESIYVITQDKSAGALKFTVSGVEEGDSLLVGESKTLTVKAEFDPKRNIKSGSLRKDIKIIINYVQK